MDYLQAAPADRKAIQALWKTCFSDDAAETDIYFETYGTGNCYIAKEGKTLLAMVLYFPTELILSGGESVSCAYLYCFCTSPDWRGKGIGRELLHFAEAELKKLGFACTALVPSETGLFGFYERYGYKTAFGCTRTEITAGKTPASAEPVSANRYLQLRQMLLWENCLMYDERELGFCKALYRFCGGELVQITAEDTIGCAAVRRDGDGLLIFDLLSGTPELPARAIMARFGAHRATVIGPGTTPYGMIKWLQAPQTVENAFLGLSFG